MEQMIHLDLPVSAVKEIHGYLCDALDVWKDTEEYLASECAMAPCIVAECSCADDATKMVRLHKEWASTIEDAMGNG